MKYDPQWEGISEKIDRYMSMNIELENSKDIFDIIEDDNQFPTGWKELMEDFLSLYDTLDMKVLRIVYYKGILRVRATSNDKTRSRLVYWLTQGVARQSIRICLITGKRTRRRDIIPGKPPLIPDIYLRYLNERDDLFL